jgi:hypothetical protein
MPQSPPPNKSVQPTSTSVSPVEPPSEPSESTAIHNVRNVEPSLKGAAMIEGGWKMKRLNAHVQLYFPCAGETFIFTIPQAEQIGEAFLYHANKEYIDESPNESPSSSVAEDSRAERNRGAPYGTNKTATVKHLVHSGSLEEAVRADP